MAGPACPLVARSTGLVVSSLVSLFLLSAASPAMAVMQSGSDTPVVIEPTLLPIEATIDAVTLYQGRAAVTRSTSSTFQPGVYSIRFEHLPVTVTTDDVQASIAAPAKLLDVHIDVVETEVDVATNPDAMALKKELDALEALIASTQGRRDTIVSSIKLVDALATRITDNEAKALAGGTIDVSKLAEQIGAIAKERDALVAQRITLDKEIADASRRQAGLAERLESINGETQVSVTGVMTIAVPSPITNPIDLHFTYLVDEAGWRPTYAVRAAADLSGLQIDYEAEMAQYTGESWENVRLTLSTAEPARAAQPAEIPPIYVDVIEMPMEGMVSSRAPGSPPAPKPAEKSPGGKGFGGGGGGGGGDNIFGDPGDGAESAARDAMSTQNSTSATFLLPRTVSLNSDKKRTQTTRIATIDLKPTYTYVARPLVDLGAYLRATVRNDSAYQLLGGRARVFLGSDSVGVTNFGDVAPSGEFELWFGADKRIQLERKLIARNSSTSGLLSKDDDLEWQWRITVKNGIETATAIEIWDRMPVSRHEDIKVELASVTPALAADKKYETNEKKQGLLKWALTLPPKTTERGPSSTAINWTVQLSKPEKTHITPLPE